MSEGQIIPLDDEVDLNYSPDDDMETGLGWYFQKGCVTSDRCYPDRGAAMKEYRRNLVRWSS